MSLFSQCDIILLVVLLTGAGNKLKLVSALAHSTGDKMTSCCVTGDVAQSHHI
jgi:hypothetical protein